MAKQSIAYAMYDMGDGFYRNEIDFTEHVLNELKGKYIAHAVEINDAGYDKKEGELKIILKKEGYGSNYAFILFNDDAINSFLNENNVDKMEDLKGKRLEALFVKNQLKWLIPSSTSMEQDIKLENILND